MEVSMYLDMCNAAGYKKISVMYLNTMCSAGRYMEISMYLNMCGAGFAFHLRYLWKKLSPLR